MNNPKNSLIDFDFLKKFEDNERLLYDTYIVVRIDGKCFTPFCKLYNLAKPFDERLINLMVSCGKNVLQQFPSLVLGYGQSDEFSFVFRKDTTLFGRSRDEIISGIVSVFASSFVFLWDKYFINLPLQKPPGFDARAVLYPNFEKLKEYLCWRQADSHINCFYNYTLNTIINDGKMDGPAATEFLKGKEAQEKYQILREHGIEYNELPLVHRRGTVLLNIQNTIIETTDDMIQESFWSKYGHLFISDNSSQ